jgi:nucleoside-diphosphate-sugar epimerase
MATILVCGGTGFVGSAIVRKLTEQHTVKVLTRKAKRSSKNIPDVEYVTGNISSIPDLERAMKNCDVVINAAQFDNAPFENPTQRFDV